MNTLQEMREEKEMRNTKLLSLVNYVFPSSTPGLKRNNGWRKILFLRPGLLGDMIVVTPLFKAIKAMFPDSEISVACSAYSEIIIHYNSYVNQIKIVNYHSLVNVIRLILWIRKQQFDWVIDLTPGVSRTSTMISKMIRSNFTLTAGMHKEHLSYAFDKVTDHKNIHIINRYKLLVEETLDCKFEGDFNPDIWFDQYHENQAQELLKSVGKNSLTIGINLSAGATVRQWTFENYRTLLDLLSKFNTGCMIILFSHEKQNDWSRRLAEEFKNVIALPKTDVLTIAAIIKKLSVFFTPDTSLMHIASGFKIPTVGIYCIGGENFIRWRTYNTSAKYLVAKNTGDVNEINPQEAFDALIELLSERK